MSDQNIEILKKETYLRAIENSPGSRIFNSLFVKFKNSGEVKDVMNDGEFSCAFFVSSILVLMQMLERSVSTVDSLRKLIVEDPKWSEITIGGIEPGDLIFWDKIKYEDGSENAHVGFSLGGDYAVSTDYKQKTVAKHSVGDRPVVGIYRYSL